MSGYSILGIADPHVALLDTLDQSLGAELTSVLWQFEGRRELRLVLHILKTGDDSTSGSDSQRKSALAINPAGEDLFRSGDNPEHDRIAAIEGFLADSLAAQVALPHDPGDISHGLPLPAGIDRIDRHKQARERTRLARIHVDPPVT